LLITADELESRWSEFDDIIDVRSPGEWSLDRVPGAVSFPVLSDAQRIEIGTLHAQSAFDARRRGAALVARNIADAVDQLADKPRTWRPLVYCWRGGNRSQAMVTVMERIGWRPFLLKGGYAEFRRMVVRRIPELVQTRDFMVVCGVTGSGKTAYLSQQAAHGAQVLDLEGLAHHRGSLLGSEPVGSQPSQKGFETAIWNALRGFNASSPILVESESRKIGAVQVPESLIGRMRISPCLELVCPLETRIRFLCHHYAHFFSQPADLIDRLERLRPLVGGRLVDQWRLMIGERKWWPLVQSLLEAHYDPTYLRSMRRNYALYESARQQAWDPTAHLPEADAQRLSDLLSFSE
jgi:tRNA 2-selenouridine synthase